MSLCEPRRLRSRSRDANIFSKLKCTCELRAGGSQGSTRERLRTEHSLRGCANMQTSQRVLVNMTIPQVHFTNAAANPSKLPKVQSVSITGIEWKPNSTDFILYEPAQCGLELTSYGRERSCSSLKQNCTPKLPCSDLVRIEACSSHTKKVVGLKR